MTLTPCPVCSGNEFFEHDKISAAGSRGPNLLPGLGRWYKPATLKIVICRSCGLMRFFASSEATDKLSGSKKWQLVR